MEKKLITSAILATALFTATGNDNSSLIPEQWANESLAILEENMLLGALVYRDFENTFANYGETVHTRKPNAFVGKRKTDDDDVTVQAAGSTDVKVVLNQWIHVSFMIKDGERSKSFKDLVNFYLRPALIAQAQFIDLVISGQAIQFIANNAGKLNGGDGTTIDGYILDAREKLTINKVPSGGRNLMLTTKTDTMCQKTAQFVSAEKRGDGGSALESANLGTLHGFQLYSAQNQPYVATGNSTNTTFIVNQSGSRSAGDTTCTITTGTGTDTFYVGTFLTFAGDEVPQRVTAVTNGTSNATAITFTPGLSHAVANSAVLTAYTYGQVDLSAGYAIGWAKEIVYKTFTVDPKIGQPVNFGDGTVYTVVAVDTVNKKITLDQPLVTALVNNQKIFLGPAGNYNLAFDQGAIALVCRPLAPPPGGLGAMSAVQVTNSFAVRVTMTYQGSSQGILTTVDALCGVKVLDSARGCLMLA